MLEQMRGLAVDLEGVGVERVEIEQLGHARSVYQTTTAGPCPETERELARGLEPLTTCLQATTTRGQCRSLTWGDGAGRVAQ